MTSTQELAPAAAHPELDVMRCALDGVSLIEASAGTGKTWNICALYVRLLLEKQLDASQILVVTFTKAATAELHERIRERLLALVHVLEQAASHGESEEASESASGADAAAASRDPFIQAVLTQVIGVSVQASDALPRLRAALRGFDQAAIHTIHAFCQRALSEAPFAAGAPFDVEFTQDDAAQHYALAVRFWRHRVEVEATRDPAFAAWAVDAGAGPDELARQLARHLKKPLAHLAWGDLSVAPRTAALSDCYERGCAHWRECAHEIREVLRAAAANLHATSHKPAALDAALAAWEAYFAGGKCEARLAEKAALLSLSVLRKKTKKGCPPPCHPFFELAEELISEIAAHEEASRRRWLALLREWLGLAPEALRRAKRRARRMSFDDLLANLYQALRAQPWFAGQIRARYPAALIDEFQDTDPLQFEIFERIYAPRGEAPEAAGPLFLVGDPKQAIYGFRAADLHTYLRARGHARARYSLAVNQRSTAPMIAACNRIFSRHAQAFILDGLDYVPVRPGARARPPLADPPAQAAALRVWMLPGPTLDAPPSGDAEAPARTVAATRARATAEATTEVEKEASRHGRRSPSASTGSAAGFVSKRHAERLAAEASANEIARLLEGGRAGEIRLGAAPISGRDIAVLVQTHRQGAVVKRSLAVRGIAAVELSPLSVFATVDADHFERLLLAIDAPADLRAIRSALATDWIGLDAPRLLAIDAAEPTADGGGDDGQGADAAMQWIERFTHYRTLWLERGFATMWRVLAGELGISERLAVGADGERRLSDVGHLAELLQAEASRAVGIEPVLRWLASQRAHPSVTDDSQLRLQSDRDLVQIVTIHKSKGLEYAIVFCPFLFDGGQRAASGTALPDACEYHDADGQSVIDYSGDAEAASRAKREAQVERAAERARLVYVALTRAVYRCYLVAGLYTSGPQASTREARQGVLNWLVAGSGEGEGDADPSPGAAAGRVPGLGWAPAFDAWLEDAPKEARVLAAWHALAHETLSVEPIESVGAHTRAGAAASQPKVFTARRAARPLFERWRISSFSALAGAAHDLGAIRPDHDETVDTQADMASLPIKDSVGADDILAFPRGPLAGEHLHRLFELADLNQPASWPRAIARAQVERAPGVQRDGAGSLSQMLERLLGDVAQTELLPGLRLCDVDAAHRLIELGFTFAAPGAPGRRGVEFSVLRTLMRDYGYPDIGLEPQVLRGYMKGFIDVVFSHQGRFYLIDWKSNHLGERPLDYGRAALEREMARHAYSLQALIYITALHRYLRRRIASYQYETHFGGALYLFVRGVRPAWKVDGRSAGVYLEHPPLALIEALDRLFGGLA